MKMYVRFINDQPNGVFESKYFKVYEGIAVEVQVDDGLVEHLPELVVELDNGETLHDVLDLEVV